MDKVDLEGVVNHPFTTTAGSEAPPEEALAVAHAGGADGWLAAALALDRRLSAVAGRPGDATLTRLRLAWWSEAVASIGSGPEPVDPDLVRLVPLLNGRADRVARVEALVAAWDDGVGEGPAQDRRPLARARAALVLDGDAPPSVQEGLTGRALVDVDPVDARAALERGLAERWPRHWRGHRLLARAARHRLDGGSERTLALKLVGWGLTGW